MKDSLDYAECSFCYNKTPIWELKDNDGECNHCANMDYVERQAILADEKTLQSEAQGYHWNM